MHADVFRLQSGVASNQSNAVQPETVQCDDIVKLFEVSTLISIGKAE